ncbi:hypothetical protein J4208_04685, partial [Candidatus Woesearchaeota archaeon]|nr:hypothetical protein [Candidatus Woesearchaeota archaeon]
MKTMLSEGPAEVIINPVRLRYSSLRKRIIAGACALVGAAAVLSIAYYPTLQKFRTIDVIYDVLDKNNNHQLENDEAQPLEDLHIALPVHTTQSEFQAMLENKSPQDV